jgi:hypothetical protein
MVNPISSSLNVKVGWDEVTSAMTVCELVVISRFLLVV